MVGGFLVSGVNTGDFNGLIPDVRVYDNALSPSDVESIYQQVLGGHAVPEPSSPALIGIAVSCLLAHRRVRWTRGAACDCPFPSARKGESAE